MTPDARDTNQHNGPRRLFRDLATSLLWHDMARRALIGFVLMACSYVSALDVQ